MNAPGDKLYQGSQTSKFLGGISFLFLIFCGLMLLGGHWLLAVIFVTVSVVTAFAGYKLSGGRKNPVLYSDLDLFGLIGYAMRSANAKIGFHSLRSQEKVINTLEHAGFPVSSAQDVRQEIRNVIAKDRRAFETCRGMIVIQCIHGGREHFWDGYGHRKTTRWFHQAEIIIDIQSSVQALIARLMELTQQSEG